MPSNRPVASAPAPWRLRRSSQGDHAVSDASGDTVASINTFHRSRSPEHDARIEATAALIVDAPDLLRVLGGIVDAWREANGAHEPRWMPGIMAEAGTLTDRLRAGRVDPAKESPHAA